MAKAMWKLSWVASSRKSLLFNSGVHTVKYEVACLEGAEVAVDIIDFGQAAHEILVQ
jgi:hypothetical protein